MKPIPHGLENNQGQALIETASALFLLICCTIAGARFFRAEWLEVRCSHQVFETALAAANGDGTRSWKLNPDSPIESNDTGTTVNRKCGNRTESVTIRALNTFEAEDLEE